MDRPLTTSEVPPRFLNTALLVGHIPHRALASDPRLSYSLYIPPEHYSHGAGVEGVDPVPAKLPLVVSIHGTRRHFRDIYDLVPFAESTPCAVLTPLFPTGLDGPNDIDSYKVLRSKTLRADLALLSMLDEIAFRWPGIETAKIFLMGFSGGGQFAHRFLYLYPERIAAVSIGAPGRTTALDDQQNWPAGIKDVEALFGKRVDKDLMKTVRIHLAIGSADVKLHGGEDFLNWLQQMKAQRNAGKPVANVTEGLQFVEQARIDTMQELRESWTCEDIETHLDIVEGVAHDSNGVRECVLAFLRPWILKQFNK
ncbi:alpha/beta-hydrolase [Hypomontagnella monticulosa]|nr:alpha/beta-hydrolase [Hypomontagnella monticulosa]